MKDFFKNIFEYHHHYNEILIQVFLDYEKQLTERSIPLFSHSLNAHQIWNSRILKTESFQVFQVHALTDFMAIEERNFLESVQILETFDLDMEIDYHDSKGNSFKNQVKDILFHITNHFTHHKGQLISDLRQQGIEPPKTDYIFYKQ